MQIDPKLHVEAVKAGFFPEAEVGARRRDEEDKEDEDSPGFCFERYSELFSGIFEELSPNMVRCGQEKRPHIRQAWA